MPWRMVAILAALAAMWSAARTTATAEEPSRTTVRQTLAIGRAFEEGLGAVGVRMNDTGDGIVLYDHALVEDDGPGISSDVEWLITDRAPTTALTGDVRIKKVLHVERPEALAARLYVERGVSIEVNGSHVETPAGTHFPVIPVGLLRAGDNEIVLSATPDASPSIKMAKPEDIYRNAPERRGTPRRSFTSTDGGKTWKPAEGEYMVRLHLVQYTTSGHVISPTIDLAREDSKATALLVPAAVAAVRLKPRTTTPDGTAVTLEARTGPCPVYDRARWSLWQPADKVAVPEGHRYLQWRASLTSKRPTETPVLHEVAVEADVAAAAPPAWASHVSVSDARNAEIRYTSIPFEYEDPNHPRMVALRKKYKLDEVVAGATSEMDKMVRLRDWVAHQWRFTAPKENYPAWDADEILSRKYGFCVQYAIVFMQCATALGHQARFVFGNHSGAVDGGGHEVCEWWSNDYGKWVFFDVNQSWHHINPKTGEPYNLLEIHDAIIRHYYGGEFAAWNKRPQGQSDVKYSPDFAACYGRSVVPNEPASPRMKTWHLKDGLYRVPSRWLNLRYMPRNNFLSKPLPVPMLQGCHWDYSDYIIWTDAQTPKEWLYRNFTGRRSDIAWTIQQVRFDATCTATAGAVAVQMGTSTPYLDTFLIKTGDDGWKASEPTFTWTLTPGLNRLEMRTRNTSGIQGPVSFVEVEYKP